MDHRRQRPGLDRPAEEPRHPPVAAGLLMVGVVVFLVVVAAWSAFGH